jgi:hypothetical protein
MRVLVGVLVSKLDKNFICMQTPSICMLCDLLRSNQIRGRQDLKVVVLPVDLVKDLLTGTFSGRWLQRGCIMAYLCLS